MNTTKIAIFVALTLAATVASAQVNRCKDATGKLMYSDRPCDAGQAGVQVQRQRSHTEIMQERELAYEAESRKQERRSAEQEREFMEQERRIRLQQAQQQAQTQQPANDWQSRKDRENAATSASSITNNGGRWDERARAERDAYNRRPTVITDCTARSCFDNKGREYRRVGNTQLIAPNGRYCWLIGNTWNCD